MKLLSAFGRTPPGQLLRWGLWNLRSAAWRRDRRYRPNRERLAAFGGRASRTWISNRCGTR